MYPVQAHKNKVQIESTAMLFSVSKLETGCFKARVKLAPPPPTGDAARNLPTGAGWLMGAPGPALRPRPVIQSGRVRRVGRSRCRSLAAAALLCRGVFTSAASRRTHLEVGPASDNRR